MGEGGGSGPPFPLGPYPAPFLAFLPRPGHEREIPMTPRGPRDERAGARRQKNKTPRH